MIRPELRPNTFKVDPTRAPPEHFEANFSYGYEHLEDKKRAQLRTKIAQKQRETTGHNGVQPQRSRKQGDINQQEANATGHNGTQRDTTALKPKARRQQQAFAAPNKS